MRNLLVAISSPFLFASCIVGGALTEEQAATVAGMIDKVVGGLDAAGGMTGNPLTDMLLTGAGAAVASYKGVMLRRDAARKARNEPVTRAEAEARRKPADLPPM
jgi:hypothetical protein